MVIIIKVFGKKFANVIKKWFFPQVCSGEIQATETNFPFLFLKWRMYLSFPLIHSKTGTFRAHFGWFAKMFITFLKYVSLVWLLLPLLIVFMGNIIRTGITCKKISCYLHESAYTWFNVKKVKIFWIYVKHFWVLPIVRKCRILIGLCK